MTATLRLRAMPGVAILVAVAMVAARCGGQPQEAEPTASILLFTKTVGYRHESIVDGVAAVRALGERDALRVVATEDAGVFTDDRLAGFAALVFLDTTGNVLDRDQEAAVERFVRAGGGFAGIHAAADGDREWAWYEGLIGARFVGHPPVQPARLTVVDRDHPSTTTLPSTWERTDEWYDFASHPDGVRVLVTVDEASYDGGLMGEGHPIAWCREYDGGRSFFTAMGHTSESFREPEFLAHLAGGIRWAAGLEPGDCSPR